ncbi:MAG: cyclic nucleotide-binding domain-containing protein [Thermoanaerobaculales bacterium]|nr:cyclic nucleotide-binding domain-containing protein [Thermoanaerobaculales bacterium]
MHDTVPPHPSFVERLVALARRLRKVKRTSEAAELLEIAATLSTDGDQLRQEARAARFEDGLEDFDREFKRRNLEASHALGMAHIFENRGDIARAIEMLDLAKLRTPFNYLGYTTAGFLYLRHHEAITALQEFIQARRLNPLDYRLAVETSRCALETEQFEVALENAIDAMLLATWRSEHEQEQERRRVDTLTRLCSLKNKEIDSLTRKRTKALQKACDHVALSQARLFSASKTRRRKSVSKSVSPEQSNLLEQANDLRSMPLFNHFTDDQLISLAQLVRVEQIEHAQVIFREEEKGKDLYLVHRGTVHVARKTSVGTQILSTLGSGALFGEVSYLDGGTRSATAFGVGSGSLFVIPAAALTAAEKENRDLAVSMLWGFWHTLSAKVRAANSQMSEIFSTPDQPLEPQQRHEGERVHLSEDVKLDILREQGLSAQEIRLLAKYSREERFKKDAIVFAEGEEGDSLFIVVDGSVRISRLVPGMGEECLTILKRGEVFGEMALIDEQPRSADARAHTEGCTVFSISRTLLEEVLSMDPDAAVQFLSLLCRLLCRRLRAMNERLVAWRIMASHE